MKHLLKISIFTIILFSSTVTLNKVEAAEADASDPLWAAGIAAWNMAYQVAVVAGGAYVTYKPFRDNVNRGAYNFGKGCWNLVTRCNWAGRENPFDRFYAHQLSDGVNIPRSMGGQDKRWGFSEVRPYATSCAGHSLVCRTGFGWSAGLFMVFMLS